MISKFAVVGIAGAVGAMWRYWLSGLVERAFSFGIPLGTFTVNVAGCFLFGLVWAAGVERMVLSVELRLAILTGFLGSFTTFSSLIFETNQLSGQGAWYLGAANLVLQIGLGLVAYRIGAAAGGLV